MKKLLGTSFIIAVMLTCSALPAFALFGNAAVDADVFGNARGMNSLAYPGNTMQPLPFVVGLNPLSEVPYPVLTYTLPFTAEPGDVVLLGLDGQMSDLIRFPKNLNGYATNQMIIMHDGRDGLVSPANVPEFVAASGALVLQETGTEAYRRADYRAENGSVGVVFPVCNYTFRVPEPATLAVLCAGVVSLLARRQRKA